MSLDVYLFNEDTKNVYNFSFKHVIYLAVLSLVVVCDLKQHDTIWTRRLFSPCIRSLVTESTGCSYHVKAMNQRN